MSDIYQVTLEPVVAIVEKDSRRADVVRQRLQQIDATVVLTEFEQAELFAEAKQNSYWDDWKFASWDDYFKSTGIDLSKREVAYRIQVSLGAKQLGINKTLLSKARWSKLKLIFTLDPNAIVTDTATLEEENMGDIMVKLTQDAPNKTLKEIAEIVKRLKGETEEPESILTWINSPIRRDAKAIVEQAVALAVKKAGTTIDILTKEERDLSNAAGLELVCAEFLADPNNQEQDFENDSEPNFEDSHDDSDEEEQDEFEDEEESDEDTD